MDNTMFPFVLHIFHILRLPMVQAHASCFLYVPFASTAIDMEDFSQTVLIRMHIIPATQVKFLIKTLLHAVIAERKLFTPS